jgi:hypothetical protein
MLHYEALRQLTLERRLERAHEAEAQRLALQASGRRHRRARRLALARGLEQLLTTRRYETQR